MASKAKISIESKTLSNTAYRKVISTNDLMQVVLMSLNPGETIPWETHPNTSQFIKVEGGEINVYLKHPTNNYKVSAGQSVVIPPGTKHKVTVVKDANGPAKLYTIYTPPEHEPGLVQPKYNPNGKFDK